MGNCASPQHTRSRNWPKTAKIINLDGRLQEFKQPIKASHVLCHNPNSFLCSIESMYVDSHVPHIPEDEQLALGQIYFLMPQSKSQAPLSLQELCALAIKASAALAQSNTISVRFSTGPPGCCKIPIGYNIIGMNSPMWRGTQELNSKFYKVEIKPKCCGLITRNL